MITLTNISIKEVVQSLTEDRIIELVLALGADRYEDRGGFIVFPTICHNYNIEDASMKLYYYKNSHMFVCYTDCGDSFDIFELYERRYKLENKEYDFYKDVVLTIAGKDYRYSNTKNGFYNVYESIYNNEVQKPEVNIPSLNENLLNIYSNYCAAEWLDEGITEEAMKYFNIKYDIANNKIIIPHYDVNGRLIGVRGRALNDEDLVFGKYMPVTISGKLCAHPLAYNLYGLNLIKDNIKKKKLAIIAEGEKSSLLSYCLLGKDNNVCVASCGSSIHRYQIDLLIAAGAEQIIIAQDKEGETWEEQQKIFNKRKEVCEKYKNLVRMGMIWDNQNLLNLKDSPFDRGKETFLSLYKNTIFF